MGRKVTENEVKAACLNRLDWWQRLGVVVHFDRQNSGTIQVNGRYIRMGKAGTADIVAYLRHTDNRIEYCIVYWIECKRPVGGRVSPDQIKFSKLWDGLDNACYEVITDPKQMDRRIEELTGYSDNKFKEMVWNPRE